LHYFAQLLIICNNEENTLATGNATSDIRCYLSGSSPYLL
jgi:hypothetical protein